MRPPDHAPDRPVDHPVDHPVGRQVDHEVLAAFAAKVAHDLNNPVSAMAMALEMAQDEVPSGNEELTDLIDRVARSVERLASRIEGLPELARTWEPEAP